MHTKIWWSYVHIRYLVHVQKWTYLALGWPYGWALNFNFLYWNKTELQNTEFEDQLMPNIKTVPPNAAMQNMAKTGV